MLDAESAENPSFNVQWMSWEELSLHIVTQHKTDWWLIAQVESDKLETVHNELHRNQKKCNHEHQSPVRLTGPKLKLMNPAAPQPRVPYSEQISLVNNYIREFTKNPYLNKKTAI